MKTPWTHRLAAAVASMAITFALFSVVVAEADPPATGSLLAQAPASTPAVR